MNALNQLRVFARYQTHAGYTWAAVCADGELLCERCVLANYREVYRATKDHHGDTQWQVIGLTYSGESETEERCSNCNKVLWDEQS